MNPPAEPSRRSQAGRRLLVGLIFLFFLFVLLAAPGHAMPLIAPWLWMAVLLGFFLFLWLFSAESSPENEPPGPIMLTADEQPPVVREVMDVRLAEEDHGVKFFRGRLREPAEAVFLRLKNALGGETVPLVQPDERCGAAILLMPKPAERAMLERPVRPWLHWLLFGLTFLTTTAAGALYQGINLLREPARFSAGLPYSIALLAILGIHELGHYWTARKHRMNVTPPFFVPVPFALGTFGAFIQMRSPAEDRRTLFDVAVAGPLAGLVVAIPALLIGLHSSELVSSSAAGAGAHDFSGGTLPGSSILFTLLANLSFGDALHPGDMVKLSPLAFAGWLGLFITGLNLLPIGQLDGGHIARSMFGSRAGAIISSVSLWLLLLLGLLVWPGLLTWALVVFFIAGRGTPPLNDITGVSRGRFWLGCFAFAILLLIMVPASVVHSIASHCPYI